MMKKMFKFFFGKEITKNLKWLYLKLSGNYIISKPIAKRDEYINMHKNYKTRLKNNPFIKKNFIKDEIEFINNLALITQVTKKKSKTNYLHGFILMKILKEYIKDKNEKINILETGTARGFSSLIMSRTLKKFQKKYKINTIDIIPHNRKIYWNCISDIDNGRVSRKELIKDYNLLSKNINFLTGNSYKILRNLKMRRINFAFLDGSHEYKDVKCEFDYIDKRNTIGDIIILDDYTPGLFDGIVRLTNEIMAEKKYFLKIIDEDINRGYVILVKK